MGGGAVLGAEAGAELTARRVESILRIAEAHRTGVAVSTLSELLPAEGPLTGSALAEWLRTHPALGRVVGETAFPLRVAPSLDDLSERRQRGELYWRRAEQLSGETLRTVHPLLRAVAVTGSAAYGEPEAGDDLDFLAITRSGALWVFLAYTYLRLRFHPEPGIDAESGACFNYVMDEGTAAREFADARGLLFAREALTARPVLGESYYRGLVESATWMRTELPRLYSRWQRPEPAEMPANLGAPLAIRALNALLFPWVAAYLQVQGVLRNRAYRRSGRPERVFRTLTHLRKLCFASIRFEQLRVTYDAASTTAGSRA